MGELDEELSFKFSEKYYKRLDKLENDIYTKSNAIGKTGKRWMKSATIAELNKKVLLCDKAIQAFNKCKEFCNSKGYGGKRYFIDNWERCHNSKNSCFSYIDSILELKDELLIYISKN